jgi:Flp pilus assembly protein CpaB
VSGVGTLILPGDRVDLAMTVSIQETGVNGPRATPDLYPDLRDDPAFKQDSSKVILQNVEVRSVIGASVAVASTGTTGGADPLSAQQIVILGVTPQQAEVIQYVQQAALTAGTALPSNNITLILRSPKDRDAPDAKTTGIVLENLIKDYGVLPPYFLEASFPPK